jgi:hypothetical protein
MWRSIIEALLVMVNLLYMQLCYRNSIKSFHLLTWQEKQNVISGLLLMIEKKKKAKEVF